MAKKKIKDDGENKKQMKFELNHELLRLEKPQNLQVQPSTKSHQGPHVLSSWMVTLPPSRA